MKLNYIKKSQEPPEHSYFEILQTTGSAGWYLTCY